MPATTTISPGEALHLLDAEDGEMPHVKPFKELSPRLRGAYERRAKEALSLAWRIANRMKDYEVLDSDNEQIRLHPTGEPKALFCERWHGNNQFRVEVLRHLRQASKRFK